MGPRFGNTSALGMAAVTAVFGAALFQAAPSAAAKGDPRIVGGAVTSISAVPYQVALVYDARFGDDDFARQFCGGTLITRRIVQTAAHCIFDGDPDGPLSDPMDTNDLDVVVGRTTLSGSGGARLNVIGGIIDSGYVPETSDFDAAWLALAADAPAPAAPVLIAGSGETALWAPGALATTSGWGTTSEGGAASDTLKAATVAIVRDATCGSLGGLYADFNAANMVCAGVLAGGVDACQGDSGGPLVAPGLVGPAPVERLVGVTSWGDGCARSNAPGVYTRIAGSDYNPFAQNVVDQLEADFALPDAGPVYGEGATPPSQVASPPKKKRKCRKGKRLKRGKCVKKKREKGKRKRR